MNDDTMCKIEIFKENHLFFVFSSGVKWRDNYQLQAHNIENRPNIKYQDQTEHLIHAA